MEHKNTNYVQIRISRNPIKRVNYSRAFIVHFEARLQKANVQPFVGRWLLRLSVRLSSVVTLDLPLVGYHGEHHCN